MPQPPRAWAALVGMARLPASVATASAAANLDLMVMVVSLWIWCGPVMALMVIGRTGGGKVQMRLVYRPSRLCEKSQAQNVAASGDRN